jgi:hypothetical protein
MKVYTNSGTKYEFRRTEKGWEGFRTNDLRMLHDPIAHWMPVRIMWQPKIGLRMSIQFEGFEYWTSTKILAIEISAEERAVFDNEEEIDD